jgi:hypothetical protein
MTPPKSSPANDPTPFQRFEDLARRLMAVPHKEVAKKMEEKPKKPTAKKKK